VRRKKKEVTSHRWSKSQIWVGHCLGKCNLMFYSKFESNDWSLFTKITIMSELMVSFKCSAKGWNILNSILKITYVARKLTKSTNILMNNALYTFCNDELKFRVFSMKIIYFMHKYMLDHFMNQTCISKIKNFKVLYLTKKL